MQCQACKGNGFSFPLVKIECHCRDPKKCMDCGGAKYKYEIVPMQCEVCRGTGYLQSKDKVL